MSRKHEPTAEQRAIVKRAAGIGLRHEQIASLVSCTEKTLRRAYRVELDEGVNTAHFNVAGKIYDMAAAGDRSMLKWWSQCRMGWRETIQITTPPNEPLTTASNEAELIGAYYERLRRAADGADPGAHTGVVAPGRPGPGLPGNKGPRPP